MTSVPDRHYRAWLRRAGTLLATALLAACSTMKVDVDGDFPEPEWCEEC